MTYTKFFMVFVLNIFIYSQASAGLFGLQEKKNNDISGFSKWNQMLIRFEEEQKLCANLPNKMCNLKGWSSFISSNKGQTNKLAILKSVNENINKVTYVEDKGKDYWSTPYQFMAKGGDCEDYAIAKFIALKKLGFSNEDMRIVVLHDTARNLMHSALIVYIGSESYMLDIGDVEVVNTKQVRNYKPLYSINETNWWLYS